MGFLPLLTLFCIFVVFLAIRYRTIDKKQDDIQNQYSRRELEANANIRRDLDFNNLEYITIPWNKFPSDSGDNEELSAALQELQTYSDKRMMNLSRKTNTDLKLEYGRNHLDEMEAIGENYNQFAMLLVKIAEILYAANDYSNAANILEFGIETQTDINKNYMLLADCYNMLGQTRKLQELRQLVDASDLTLSHAILKHIDDFLQEQQSTPEENFPAL